VESKDWKIIALIRDNEFLFTYTEMQLKTEDEIVILRSKENLEIIKRNFEK
jgi:NhaP-type Na+/H+ and K+/H+ antiporter